MLSETKAAAVENSEFFSKLLCSDCLSILFPVMTYFLLKQEAKVGNK